MSTLEILIHAFRQNPDDLAALLIFIFCWLGYEPLLRRIGKRFGVASRDLSVIRAAWMRQAAIRDVKLFDSNLMAHAVNSATHFSQANLILVAAVTGVLFGGRLPLKSVQALGFDIASPLLLQIKLGLIILCLARGLLDFIWALRQMNYCAAAMGSLPEDMDASESKGYAQALANVLEPAMSSFSMGVRGYYFSLAAAAWLFGPVSLVVASIGAIALLAWRQSRSQASRGLRQLRELIESRPLPPAHVPHHDATAQYFEDNAAPRNKKSDT
ncbi:MAG: DUF599 domain-containing protein [Asticcacaulis sp.]